MEDNIKKLLEQYNDPFQIAEFFMLFRNAVIEKIEKEIAVRKERSNKDAKEAEELSGFLVKTSTK